MDFQHVDVDLTFEVFEEYEAILHPGAVSDVADFDILAIKLGDSKGDWEGPPMARQV